MKMKLLSTLLLGFLFVTGCSSTRGAADDVATAAVDAGEGVGDAAGDVVDAAADAGEEAAEGVADAADAVGDVAHQAVHGEESEDDALLEGDANAIGVPADEAEVITEQEAEVVTEQETEVVAEEEVEEESAMPATAAFAATEVTWTDDADATASISFAPMGDHYMLSSEFTGLRGGDYTLRVHEGTSCENPGGAYVPVGENGYFLSPSEQSWGSFTVEDGAGTFEGADFGLAMYGRQDLAGHAVIVYDSMGNRAGCGIIAAQ